MKLSDLTIKDVRHIGEIISEGCEGVIQNIGLNGQMTEEEYFRAECVLLSFQSELRNLTDKQNLKETE